MNALTQTQPGTALTTMDEGALVNVMQNSLYPGARPESVAMVLSYCRARGLDPLRKPVHIVPMWVKPAGQRQGGAMQDVVMPGIALYRIEAARTGEYAGKTEPEFGPTVTRDFDGVKVSFPEWCKVTVQRMVGNQLCAFTAKEYWLENYATASRDSEQPNTMWRKRAFGQLAKCAEAQALRMAFPEATGGEPTAEEMEGKVLGDSAKVVQNKAAEAPAGSMREYAQQIAKPAAETWPIVTPDGEVRQCPRGKWLAGVSKALAMLEDGATLYAWRDAMAEHVKAVAADDEIAAAEADRLIADRLDEITTKEGA